MSTKIRADRRHFMTKAVLGLAALPLIPWLGSNAFAGKKKEAAAAKDVPLPAGEKAVDEKDTVAAAIGYKAHAKDIDLAKYPQRKKADAKNQSCDNCALYTKTNDGWGKCQMLTTGLVAAKGWCGSYNKKA